MNSSRKNVRRLEAIIADNEAIIAAEKAKREKEARLLTRVQNGKALSLEFALRHMTDTIATLPEGKRIEASIGDCVFRRLRPESHRAGIIRLAQLRDGAALIWTTQEFLADGTHVLQLPRRGAPTYDCDFVNVDYQAVPGNGIHLVGYKEIAQDDLAVNAIHFGAGALAVEAVTGWSHAITSASTLGIKPPTAAPA